MSLLNLLSTPFTCSPIKRLSLINEPVECANDFKHWYVGVRAMGEDDVDCVRNSESDINVKRRTGVFLVY